MKKVFDTKSLVNIALATTIIILGTFVTVPLGYIPFSLQSFSILLIALLLSPIESGLSALIYMIIGLVGIPVFAGFTGGLHSIFKPSFGFIIGFIFAAYICSYIYSKNRNRKNAIFSLIIGEIIIYSIGLIYMYIILKIANVPDLGFIKILSLGMLPFIPGDTIKILVILLIYKRLDKAINRI